MKQKIYIIRYNWVIEEWEIIQEFEYSYLCIFDNKETLIKKSEIDSPFNNIFTNVEKLKEQIKIEIIKRKEQLKNLENFTIN